MLVGVDEVDWSVSGKTKWKIGEKCARSKGGQKPKPTFIDGAEIDAVGGKRAFAASCTKVETADVTVI